MERLGIAFSGGPSPAEIVDCIMLAESLGYEFGLGRGGPWRRSVRDPRRRRGADLAHPARHQHHQRLRPHRADNRDGRRRRRRHLGRALHPRDRVEPQGAGRGRAWRRLPKPLTRVRETVAAIRGLLRDGSRRISGRDRPHREFRPVVRAAAPGVPVYVSAVFPKMIALCGEIADGVMLTRSTLDTAARVRELSPKARARAGRDPGGIVDRDAVADDRRREPRGGARRAAARARLLCRVFPALQPDDGRARFRRQRRRRSPQPGRAATAKSPSAPSATR